MRLLLLDNYDSFSTNLKQLLEHAGAEVHLAPNDAAQTVRQLVQAGTHDAIVVSPGPGSAAHPADFGMCASAYSANLPVLGVCLGHQGLALAFGGSVVAAPEPVHGRLALVSHDDGNRRGSLLEGIPSQFQVVRYHSLTVDAASLPSCLRATARTADGLIMAMEHVSRPLFGVQFHPESVCSEHGREIADNFLRRVAAESPRPMVWPASAALLPKVAAPPTASAAAVAAAAAPSRLLLICRPSLARSPEPESIFDALFAAEPYSFWLDAADTTRESAPFSYMGCSGGPHSLLLVQRRCGHVVREQLSSALRSAAAADDVLTEPLDAVMRVQIAEWKGARHARCVAHEVGGRACAAVDGEPLPEGTDDSLLAGCTFRGGLVGYFGYEAWHTLGPAADAAELRRRIPKEPSTASAPRSYADTQAAWLFADRLVAIDHAKHGQPLLLCLCEASEVSSGLEWIASTARALRELAAVEGGPRQQQQPPPLDPPPRPASAREPVHFVSDRSRQRYIGDIDAIAQHLRSGDSYEVCLTTTFRCGAATTAAPLGLYRTLRRFNPAPHAAYLRLDPHRDQAAGCRLGQGGVAICCSSPERFLRVSGSRVRHLVESKPIKGTARRGATPVEDDLIASVLRSGEKERSENMMIVDLIRNDLGRVCAAGTVQVPNLMHVESFASVHQLVSTVRGALREGEDAISAVAATFPPGSMTGAPKSRTMRIIDELELGTPRGVYSGSLGFFSIDGGCDLNVVIRTAVIDERGMSIAAGGAIVALSNSADEYEEVLLKARPVMRAVAHCIAGEAEAYVVDDHGPQVDEPGGGVRGLGVGEPDRKANREIARGFPRPCRLRA